MIETEIAQAMTYANQIDARVQLNDANVEVWWEGLRTVSADAARWAIKKHYAGQNANGEGAHVINPATIRRLITAEVNRQEQTKRALEPPKGRAPNPISFRKRDPERWDQLVAKGRSDHLADLARRGIKTQAVVDDSGFTHAQGVGNGA